jgi:hypothetical protein
MSDIYRQRSAVTAWLRVKFKHEERGPSMYALIQVLNRAAEKHRGLHDTIPWRDCMELYQQLLPDADHSALLVRLLEGKEPLPDPPPVEYAYPKYPDAGS